jgi:hypothetical protein
VERGLAYHLHRLTLISANKPGPAGGLSVPSGVAWGTMGHVQINHQQETQ